MYPVDPCFPEGLSLVSRMQPSNTLLGALHRERVARAAPRCSTVRLNGGAGPTLRLRERPGKHIGSHIWPGGGILLDFLLGGGRDLLTCRGEDASSEQTATPAALLALELGSGVGSLGLSLAGIDAARQLLITRMLPAGAGAADEAALWCTRCSLRATAA